MTPELLVTLITQVGIPEVSRWLSQRRKVDPITDEEILAKLQIDASRGIEIGRAWLKAHPKEAHGETTHLHTEKD